MKADKSNLYGYNKKLRGLAKANRKTMTKAEACLWKYVLRASQMKGYPFRRQRPVLNYIADFMCKELKLVIEVDGITHSFFSIQKNDRVKQKDLESAGFTVLRFEDNEVLTSIDIVRLKIEDWIEHHPLNPPPGAYAKALATEYGGHRNFPAGVVVPLSEGGRGRKKELKN